MTKEQRLIKVERKHNYKKQKKNMRRQKERKMILRG